MRLILSTTEYRIPGIDIFQNIFITQCLIKNHTRRIIEIRTLFYFEE